MQDAAFDYDWIVGGSGLGGSVAALRLAEKGWRVAVLQTGSRLRDEDFAKTGRNLRRMFWLTFSAASAEVKFQGRPVAR